MARSTGKEVKDFIEAFNSTRKNIEDGQYKRDMIAYLKEKNTKGNEASLADRIFKSGHDSTLPAGSVGGGGGALDAAGLIKRYEGFRTDPYWDVNAHRIGYGSDTITKPDGTVVKVAPGMTVTREDAERDLARRIPEFQATAKQQVGEEVWNKLNPQQQAALTSMTYNYGSLPASVADAVKGGGNVEAAIRARADDNDGINARRRGGEADIYAGRVGSGPALQATPAAIPAAATSDDDDGGYSPQPAAINTSDVPLPPVRPTDLPTTTSALAEGRSVYAECGGPVRAVRHYAEGGTVDDDDDLGLAPEGPAAIPSASSGVAPMQQAAPQMPDLGDVLTSAASYIHKAIAGTGGAIETSPVVSAARKAFFQGDDAADSKDAEAVGKIVDPDGNMTESLRNARGLQALYQHYLTTGDVDKAQKAAASMLMYYRSEAARFGGQAIDALRKGDVQTATDLLVKADNKIPNGRETRGQVLPDGNVGVIQTDASGKVTFQGKVTPQQMLAAAMGLKDGSEYWRQLSVAAGKKDPAGEAENASPEQPSEAYRSYVASRAQPAAPRTAINTEATIGDDDYASVQPASVSTAPTEAIPTAPTTQAIPTDEPRPALPAGFPNMSAAEQRTVSALHNDEVAAWKERQARRQKAIDDSAPASPAKLGDRAKAKEMVDDAHTEFLTAASPDPKQPLDVPAPQATAAKNAAAHIMALNNTQPAEAVAAVYSLTKVDPAKPNAENFKVEKGTGDTVKVTASDGSEYTLDRAGFAALSNLRRLRAQKAAEVAKAADDAKKPGPAARGVKAIGEGIAGAYNAPVPQEDMPEQAEAREQRARAREAASAGAYDKIKAIQTDLLGGR